MKKTNLYLRRTISLSPQINDLLVEGAKKEFGGNLSAYLAHIVLDYVKCKNCTKKETSKIKSECEKTQ